MLISRRKLVAVLGSAAAITALGSTSAFADKLKVAIVMPGNITDKSWSQAGYEGINQAGEALDLGAADGRDGSNVSHAASRTSALTAMQRSIMVEKRNTMRRSI